MTTPEQEARLLIDALLVKAGWHVCNMGEGNIHAHRGLVFRNFPLRPGHGFADYLFYLDGKAAGVIEAKKVGTTLSGVEIQSAKYTQGLPDGLPYWRIPLPFAFESTGIESFFTNGLDPDPRSRPVFAFHKPEFTAKWLAFSASQRDEAAPDRVSNAPMLRANLRRTSTLQEEGFGRTKGLNISRQAPRGALPRPYGSQSLLIFHASARHETVNC
jgi:type I restriction enzyme, R subunit